MANPKPRKIKAGDIIFIRPGTDSQGWMSVLGPLLVVNPRWTGHGGLPEVSLLDGSDPTSRRDADGRYCHWQPHVEERDCYIDEFLTAARKAKLSQK